MIGAMSHAVAAEYPQKYSILRVAGQEESECVASRLAQDFKFSENHKGHPD